MRLPAPCYVFSDAHLGAAPAETERDLLAFLRELPGDAASLVINGDLFDFWFEWRHVVPRSSVRVLGELARLRARGLPILWIAGNHDCWGGEVLRGDLGLDYHVGEWRGDIAGLDVVIEHGDGLREREDAPYRRLRTVLRHPWAIRAYRWIHPDVGTWIALRSSHTSRNMRPRDGGDGLRRVAEARLSAPGAPNVLILGHSHLQALERIGRGVFANPGAWIDAPTMLRLSARKVELLRWTSAGVIVEQTLDAGR